MSDVVEMKAVSRRFEAGGLRVDAVRDVDLSVRERELVAVLGRSGSGKTTLLSIAGGLDRADAGQVSVGGHALEQLDEVGLDKFRRSTVGWVFQTSGLLPLLTAAENVALALRIQGFPEAEAQQKAVAALDAVGLAERAAHRAYELSGGEQQRAALARALVKQPRLLLADEPTGQLDSETALEVVNLLREAAASGITVLLATHDAALADAADRVLRMEDGRLT
jgi:putative ABC transport system ATP-binding protein